MTISIKTLLTAMFGVLLTVIVGQGLFGLTSLNAIGDVTQVLVEKRMPALSAIARLDTALAKQRVAQYRVLNADKAEEQAAQAALDAAVQEIQTATKLVEGGLWDQKDIDLFRSLQVQLARGRGLWDDVAALAQAGDRDNAVALFTGAMSRNAGEAEGKLRAFVDDLQSDVAAQSQELQETIGGGRVAAYGALGFGALVALVSLLTSRARVVRPIGGMTLVMRRLAEGDLTAEVPDRARRDEIGAMAAAVQTFKEGLTRNRALEAETAQARLDAEVRRRQIVTDLADRFENAIGAVVGGVSSAATEMQATAEQLTKSANETSRRSSAVATASEEASVNVTSVAAAAEEMGHSVQEIGRQVERSAHMSVDAVAQAEATASVVAELTDVAGSIGVVVEMIASLAAQTNLLALNATIEAARAGEAGRGFAVVASEVKQLATQTASATAEIDGKVTAIRASSGQVASAIAAITGTIQGLSQVAGAIAAAVEQQNATTREIVVAISEASRGANDVSSGVGDVARAADEAGAGASQVLSASGELAHQAETLRSEVHSFLATVRAA